MLLIIIIILLEYFYKNTQILKIKSFDDSKTTGKLINLIKSKKRKNISKLVILDNDDNKIISFINNISNPNNFIITKTNSNENINMFLIDKCSKYNVDYCIGRKLNYNFLNIIFRDFNFIFKKIIFPCLYFIIIFNCISIIQQLNNSITNNNKFTDISSSFENDNENNEIYDVEINIVNNSNYSNYSNNSIFTIKSTKKQNNFFKQNVSLSNWVGSPEIFDECYEIISYQVNNSNYKKLGAVLPKGILLEGPPGVGKTYLAKAIATETESSFFSISGSEFIEIYVGVGASRVRDLFKKARLYSPSIIFIDEIDAMGGRRSGGNYGSNREHDQTLNQLLTEMDGFNDNSEIIVMAATNRKDMLDSALLRPGRFDRHIHISLPDKYSREQILQLYLKEKKRKEKNINITIIAELTDGFSGADLKNLINEAAILAARRGGNEIKLSDLTNAMEKLIVGLERKYDDRSIEAKYRVGIHEVGHAFLTIYFNNYFDLQKISIKSTYNGAGGYTLLNEKKEYSSSGLYTKDLLYKKIIILLGGKAAESIWYGNEQVSLGSTQDLKQANTLARKMVELFGMGTNDLETFYNVEHDYSSINTVNSDKTKELIDSEIINIVSTAYKESKQILKQYKLVCDEIVDNLIRNEILYRKDLDLYYNLTIN